MGKLRWRYSYAVLLVLPATFGNNNVRDGGDYLPGAFLGLLTALLFVAFIEGGLFIFRVVHRLLARKNSN